MLQRLLIRLLHRLHHRRRRSRVLNSSLRALKPWVSLKGSTQEKERAVANCEQLQRPGYNSMNSIDKFAQDRPALRNLRLFFKVLRDNRHGWVIAAFGMITLVLMKLPMPLLTGYIIDRVIGQKNLKYLTVICISVLLITAFYLFVNYLTSYMTLRLSQSIAIRFKVRLLRHVQSLPVSYISLKQTGYLLSRITQDPAFLNGVLLRILTGANSLLTFGVGLATIFLINPSLAVMSVVLLPFFILSYTL